MASRDQNDSQMWHCEICGWRTVHEIGRDDGDGVEPSHWRNYDGIRAYWRKHICAVEELYHSSTATVEIPEETFLELLNLRKLETAAR